MLSIIKYLKTLFKQLFFLKQNKEQDAKNTQYKKQDNIILALHHSAKNQDAVIKAQQHKIEQYNQLDRSLDQLQSQLEILKNTNTK